MQDAADARRSCFPHHCGRVLFSIAGVDYDRPMRVGGNRELGGKGPPLQQARRMVIVVVEAAFTDRDGSGSHLDANGGRVTRGVEVGGVVRMDTRRKENATGIFDGDLARALCGIEGFPDRHDRRGPCSECPVNNSSPIRLESRIGEMGVRIEKAQWAFSSGYAVLAALIPTADGLVPFGSVDRGYLLSIQSRIGEAT